MLALYKIDWTEYEKGWGSRPDGSTLHLTKEGADQFIREYWDSMPDRGPGGSVPDEYSAPGTPYLAEATAEQVAAVEASEKKAIWL